MQQRETRFSLDRNPSKLTSCSQYMCLPNRQKHCPPSSSYRHSQPLPAEKLAIANHPLAAQLVGPLVPAAHSGDRKVQTHSKPAATCLLIAAGHRRPPVLTAVADNSTFDHVTHARELAQTTPKTSSSYTVRFQHLPIDTASTAAPAGWRRKTTRTNSAQLGQEVCIHSKPAATRPQLLAAGRGSLHC